MMTIKFDTGMYYSDQCNEAWLTSLRLNKSRLVEIWIPGSQYMKAINEQLKKRGLKLELR